jgi:hypothetical protein
MSGPVTVASTAERAPAEYKPPPAEEKLMPPPIAAPVVGKVSAVRLPDFKGRDKQFAYLKTRILEGLRQGANFARHYTIVGMGCGTGCSSNLMIDRRTGEVSRVPYGGELQQMLTLRHQSSSNLITATWFDDDLCVLQEARWDGAAFDIDAAPRGQSDATCRN